MSPVLIGNNSLEQMKTGEPPVLEVGWGNSSMRTHQRIRGDQKQQTN